MVWKLGEMKDPGKTLRLWGFGLSEIYLSTCCREAKVAIQVAPVSGILTAPIQQSRRHFWKLLRFPLWSLPCVQ